MEKYVMLDKKVGETPLQCVEAFRATRPDLTTTPLAYAGRLDPMASGKLLVLIGEECKHQHDYHGLEKKYEFSILFGTQSDTGDVLGVLDAAHSRVPQVSEATLRHAASALTGPLTFPYPAYSARTVHGKPLHTWAVEERLGEIERPTYTATVHTLELLTVAQKPATEVVAGARAKIDSLPPVTELRKAIGNDFRRPDVRTSWNEWERMHTGATCTIATFRCHCSAGLYMRTLAEAIAARCDTVGLAFSIHRSQIFGVTA